MKFALVLAVLFLSVFSLSAQTGANISIYILPITGRGSAPDDNQRLAELLAAEVKARNYTLLDNTITANYFLMGTLSPYTGAEVMPRTQLYVFNLKLKDPQTGVILAEQDLFYESSNDFSDLFTLMMFNIFSRELGKKIEEPEKPILLPRNNWLFAGAAFFWSPRLYLSASTSVQPVNFGGGVSLEFMFHNYFSVELGAEIASDWIVVSAVPGDEYRDMLLGIPLSLKFIPYFTDKYLFDVYTGIHFNLPLFNVTDPPLLSWLAGFQFGVKAGPGMVFIDPRFSMDIGKSNVNVTSIQPLPYKRFIFHVSLGYKIGILPK